MKVVEWKKIDENHEGIYFLRVDPEDISITLKQIIMILSDLSWIAQFDKEYIRVSFEKRATDTADFLASKLVINEDNSIISDAGEYIVSEMAREAIISHLNYKAIPLAELFKEKIVGNPGFDYYSATNNKIIIFGEAKYLSNRNAYGSGMEQVAYFIKKGQDM